MPSSEFQNATLEDQPALGEIKINHSVVANIVRLTAQQVPGVAGVGGSFVDGLTELFSRKNSDRGVRIEEDERDNYLIEIRLVVLFGAEIGKTAYEVQTAVRKQVGAMTGKGVGRVDVVVEGVRPKETEHEAKPDEPWPDIPATD